MIERDHRIIVHAFFRDGADETSPTIFTPARIRASTPA